MIDGWTLGHIAAGALLAMLGGSRVDAWVLAVGTEIVEHSILKGRVMPGFFEETRANIVADVFVTVMAYEFSREADL